MSKLDEAMLNKIYDAVRDGQPVSTIHGVIGVSRPTFWAWREKAELAHKLNEDNEFAKLFDIIENAKSMFVNDNLKVIKNAAQRDWKAAAWLLERRVPEHFAIKQDTNMTIQGIEVKNDIPKIELKTEQEEAEA